MYKLLLLFLGFLTVAQSAAAQSQKPNVLFICVDDLRPDLGCYGNKEVKSPNIDRLASTATVFTKQFVGVPTCGASRACILTGAYPRQRSLVANDAAQVNISGRPKGVHPETFIEQFKRNGYYTVGMGKISHAADGYLYGYNAERSNQLELPNSWDEMLFNPGKWKTGWNAFFGFADGSNRNAEGNRVKPYERGDVNDEGYVDGLTSALAVDKIKALAMGQEKPFFLAVGFFKPHLPFNAPQKYWDLYDEEKLTLTPSPQIPENINTASLHQSGELSGYRLGEEKPSLKNPVSDAYARKLRHAYYAGVSYIDAQIGKVLDALKESGLEKNTIVVLWGDHGWHLGDDRVWGKHTLTDWSLRSAFMIKTPEMTKARVCNRVISAVDVYPTLMELCDLQMPDVNADGRSLVPLIRKTNKTHWRDDALSFSSNGISVRTPRYRMTKYFRGAKPDIELYDYKKDPYGQKNIAAEKPDVVEKMLTKWNGEIEQARKMYRK